MPGTYTNLNFHVVFATKGRRPTITPEIEPRLHAYMASVIRGEGGIVSILNGTADHVHILLKTKPDMSLSKLIGDLKSRSSGWVHRELGAADFWWQGGFAAFSVSESQCARVEAYIGRQKEHHTTRSFRDELREFLEANGIPFDPARLED